MVLTPKLVAFDLDGTLALSKQIISPKIATLLKELLEKMPVAVLSGAGFPQFETQFISVLPIDTRLENLYIFANNAAQCFVYRDGSWHAQYDQSLTPGERAHIMEGLHIALEETGLATPPAQLWGERIEDRGAQVTFSGLGQQAPLHEKEQWDPTREKREPLRQVLLQKLPEFSVATGGSTSVDITRKGITKAYGIRELSQLLSIPISDMLYVGDALQEGGNDSIVKETGISTQAVSGPEDTEQIITHILS